MAKQVADTYLITGGLGFIASNFILDLCSKESPVIVNIDLMTYAASRSNLKGLKNHGYHLKIIDIGNEYHVAKILKQYKPNIIVNFASESHVDNSIDGPEAFLKHNVVSHFNFIKACSDYFQKLSDQDKARFKFLHVNTDEVYGSLKKDEPPFHEGMKFQTNSIYSATKACQSHFLRAFHETWKFPYMETHCSNNYGPRQHKEKLIPKTIINAWMDRPIPVYGTGTNVRDWIHVSDHCSALSHILKNGKNGHSYNIGAENEISNIEIVNMICEIVDRHKGVEPSSKKSSKNLIKFVEDRKGHDFRYAIDNRKIYSEIKWIPLKKFHSGLEETVSWYLKNVVPTEMQVPVKFPQEEEIHEDTIEEGEEE